MINNSNDRLEYIHIQSKYFNNAVDYCNTSNQLDQI